MAEVDVEGSDGMEREEVPWVRSRMTEKAEGEEGDLVSTTYRRAKYLALSTSTQASYDDGMRDSQRSSLVPIDPS